METASNQASANGAPVKKTDLETDGLKGAVKRVMLTTYKAHQRAGSIIQGKIEDDYTFHKKNTIVTYDEQGKKTEELLYGTDGIHKNTFTTTPGFATESIHYAKDGKVLQTTSHKLTPKDQLLETICLNGDGSTAYKVFNTYTEDGKQLSSVTLHGRGGKEILYEKSEYTYDEKGNQLTNITYNGDGEIKTRYQRKYNDEGKLIESIEEITDKTGVSPQFMRQRNVKWTYRYNQHGDCIETRKYSLDGKTLIDTFFSTYEYDSEGKKIPPPAYEPADPNAKVPGETEEVTTDAHGNWVRKTTFYNKIPLNILVRAITYYGEEEKNLVHPLTMAAATEVADTTYEREEDLPQEDARWLVEAPNATAENFSYLRYYTMLYNEPPSIKTYNGPYIEAVNLLRELKENMKAQEVHSNTSIWHYRHQLHNYTLTFPRANGYMLHVSGINSQDAEEFDVPDNIDTEEYMVHFGGIHLLIPSETSGRRDRDFEEEVEEYIRLCQLSKKPEKPMINMIETTANGFIMREHAVNDDFEIKDLDINYGYGFQKFHDDLIHRFNKSTKGLVLFHGEPGTGKTYYIRHLLRTMVSNKKVVIYMPPNMVDHLVEPVFMTFLTEQIKDWTADGFFCVLLIEDAEPLLAKRIEGVRIQGITNLLNMTDGLLNDMLNLQIICTFNVDLKKLDSALLRPGRLIARKEFKPLSELDANLLAQRLGIKHHFTGPATLGEIYAMQANKEILIHDVEADKDASELIDDLL